MSVGRLAKDQETYYLSEVIEGREDYYLDPGEAPGRWTGRLADELSVCPVSSRADDLRAVLAGARPERRAFRFASRRATVPGFDLTLSAPKGISVTWALVGSGDRRTDRRRARPRASTPRSPTWSATPARVRRGHAGAEVVDGDGFVAAAFRHRTSRAGDPQLHTHVLVANMSRGPDGRWTALDSRSIYAPRPDRGLRLPSGPPRRAGALGRASSSRRSRHGHADIAGRAARPPSAFQPAPPRDQQPRWSATARRARGARRWRRSPPGRRRPSGSRSPSSASGGQSRRGASTSPPESLPRLVRSPAIDADDADLAAILTEHDATFARRDAVRAVAEAATQGASARRDRGTRRSSSSTASRRSRSRPIAARRRRFSPSSTAPSTSLRAGQASGRGLATRPMQSPRAIAERPSLGEDQRAAVEAITRSGNAVDVVIGPAGTGKTFLLDAAREAWQSSGKRVDRDEPRGACRRGADGRFRASRR